MSSTLSVVFASDDERWRAVVERNLQAEGKFFYSVRPTGVFCRPTCGSRRPLRENVAFHTSAADARAGGFRPCRRCRPEEKPLATEWAEAIARACRTIENSAELPSTGALAAAAAMSTSHFQRIFKRVTGLTPKAYSQSVRSDRLRAELHGDRSITDSLYNCGFGSSSRFYSGAPGMLGMTPTNFRAGGAGLVMRFGVAECSLGSILVAATDAGVCAVYLGGDADELVVELQKWFPNADLVGGDREFERWMAEVIGLVESPGTGVNLPLDVRGTAFQRLVWQALGKIPPGTTSSYSEVARSIGRPTSVRAVAAACAANHLAVVIPCHRVVRTDHGISGYRWGVERKRELLRREASPPA